MVLDYETISRRMDFLRRNQKLAKKRFGKNKAYCSNCHGTVAYLYSAEEFFKSRAQENNNLIYIEGRPGCAGRDLMKDFLESKCNLVAKNHQFGDIVSIWAWIYRTPPNMPQPRTREEVEQELNLPPLKTIQHTAVLVEPKKMRVFHQQDSGEKFEIESLKKYMRKWFHRETEGGNLFIDVYRLKDFA